MVGSRMQKGGFIAGSGRSRATDENALSSNFLPFSNEKRAAASCIRHEGTS